MRLATAGVAAVTAASFWLSGCGSDRDHVRATVNLFASAASAHDYAALCGQVLAPALIHRMQAGGISCREAMAVAFDSVEQPQLSIGRILVHGNRAEAITLSTARGQTAAIETVELVRTSDGWRISALSSPLKRR